MPADRFQDIEIEEGPSRFDVKCERIPPDRMAEGGRVKVSIPQFVVHHSPAGFEWGYEGSGPADLALNILHMHCPPGADGKQPVKLYRGWTSQVAWDLHQKFKREFVAKMPDAGGVILGADVRAWLARHWTPGTDYTDPRFRFRLQPGEGDEG